MHTTWHAVLYTCAVLGAMTLTVIVVLLALLAREIRRARKQQRGEARVVAAAEALLRENAGGGTR